MYFRALRVNRQYSTLVWISSFIIENNYYKAYTLINNGTRYFKLNNKQIAILILPRPKKNTVFKSNIFMCDF